jgi:hypothetical protein
VDTATQSSAHAPMNALTARARFFYKNSLASLSSLSRSPASSHSLARIFLCSVPSADVKLFDLRTQTMRWETNVGNGVIGLDFDRKDIEMNKLVVTVRGQTEMRVRHTCATYLHSTRAARLPDAYGSLTNTVPSAWPRRRSVTQPCVD